MPIVQTKMQPSKPIFTKQDYLDGKCTKDGFPLGKGEVKLEEEPKQPEAPQEETQSAPEPEAPSQPEAPAEEAPAEAEEPKEGE